MRLWAPITVCAAVALAAWFLVREGPRRGGDGVTAVPAGSPDSRRGVHSGLRDLSAAPEPTPSEERAPSVDQARSVAAAQPTMAPSTAGASETPEPVAVSGFLRSESGTWRDLAGLLSGGVVVELFDLADPTSVRRAELETLPEPDGSTAIAFRFERVPPGRHRLGVSSLVAEVWEPASVLVDAPSEGLVLWCRDRVDRVRLGFEVRDAQDGTPIEGWEASALRQSAGGAEGVLLHAGPLEREAFPMDGRLEWSIAAPGYAPAFGDERDFAPAEEGVWVARVALRRGFAARVVVLARDPIMRGIEGARVELDGGFAGLTDGRGRLDVAHPALPDSLTVRWNGRDREISPVRAGDSPEALRRGQMLVVVLE